MEAERRGRPVQPDMHQQPRSGRIDPCAAKSFNISKQAVWQAWKQVKANQGGAGIDGESLSAFEADLANNLYRLWNRLASGSYHPPPVKCVEIPKGNGKTRALGIPTVSDRVAQMVVKQAIEPQLEAIFHKDSYGYRPGKSAHQALAITRQRCWQHRWVLDMDIEAFFDHLDHSLLNRALDRHVTEKWQRLYIQRWLSGAIQHPDGQLEMRERGTPQGGVISPLLANLYLHYSFDQWMQRHYPGIPFARYADDIICHCQSKAQAEALQDALQQRFAECGLRLHPEKTRIINTQAQTHPGNKAVHRAFDFLGYQFRPRTVRCKNGRLRMGYTPAISPQSAKRIRGIIKAWQLPRRRHWDIHGMAKALGPVLRGWQAYYSQWTRDELKRIWYYFSTILIRWCQKQYKQ